MVGIVSRIKGALGVKEPALEKANAGKKTEPAKKKVGKTGNVTPTPRGNTFHTTHMTNLNKDRTPRVPNKTKPKSK